MRLSPPSFAAGAVAATILLAIPATALVAAAPGPDPNPDAYDGTSPSLTMAPVQFAVGSSIDAAEEPGEFCASSPWNFRVPLRMRWWGDDGRSGLAGYDVWGYGPAFDGYRKLVEQTGTTSYDYTGSNYTGDCGEGGLFDNRFWVVAKDNRGNTATTNLAGQYLTVWEETGRDPSGESASLPLTRTGTWSVSHCTCYNNGRTLYSRTKGASLTYKVTTVRPGQTLAVVAEKATDRGTAEISVDGGTPTTVNTYASSPRHRVIVWQRSLSVGRHTVKITNAGTPGHSRVDVDTLMLTRGPMNEAPPELPQSTP